MEGEKEVGCVVSQRIWPFQNVANNSFFHQLIYYLIKILRAIMLHIKMDSGDILQCSKNHASSVQSSAKFCIRWRNVDIPDGFGQVIDGVVGNIGIIQ